MKLDRQKILQNQSLLENHSLLVTNTIQTVEDLRIFMSHHVYAVWDFMSLLKSIQHAIVPSKNIWLPDNNTRSDVARVINEIVLCEESDISPDGGSISHFDLYLLAMMEIGADISHIYNFIENVRRGDHPSVSSISSPANKFMKTTFDVISKGPHCAAASFTYGRETVIPKMFTRILNQLAVSKLEAPKFYYYLQRHIEVDGDQHGPLSEDLVTHLCENDPKKFFEAEQAAITSIKARIRFFDEIEKELNIGNI